MRRIWSLVLVCALVIGFASLALAQEGKSDMKDKDTMQGCMGKMGKPPMMMPARSMIATPDGGVIVLAGNKLQKYDKDLVLQKEVELKSEAKK